MDEVKGLTREEVEEKVKQGKINKIKTKANESVFKIIGKNIFTYFNLIFLILAILLITSQSYRNLTFLIIITINILIGIYQQIKSKITLDKLSLLDKSDYIVIRDGKKEKIVDATTIGYKKIIDLQGVETDAIEIRIEDSRVAPVISFVGVY